jgi:hypothetical protein
MADFDLASATPVQAPEFDLASARPVGATSGSPQFDAARAALIKSNPGEYDPSSAAWQAKYGATSGNNFLQNARIGAGKLYTDIGLGAQQLYARGADFLAPKGPTLSGLITGEQPSRLSALEQEAAEKRQLDQAVEHTWGGKTGEVVGALPLAFVPGAATLRGAAIMGGAQGLFNPVVQGESAIGNTLEGAAIGGLGYGGANLVGKIAGRGYEALASALGLRAKTAEDVLARTAARSPQNMGAAAASPNLENVSPEFKKAVVDAANQNQGVVHDEALQRHIQAQSLPVKVDLMEGQALQNPTLMSNESNLRAAIPKIAQRVNTQNTQLAGNLQALRESAGPNVFTTNATEYGDTLIQAYKDLDEKAQAEIGAKYQALRDANGGNFPVNGQSFVQNADAALSQNMKAPFLPTAVDRTLDTFRNGQQMSLENFENLRTTLAAEARKAARAGDGNAAMAVNLVRDQLEALPMSQTAAPVKALADDARMAARARFQALEADPAYKAAVNDTVPPDRFASRFVIGGTRDNVATMARNLGGNDTARQTMAVATLDALRGASKIDSAGNGNFSSPGFNAALEALSPKLNSLVDRQTAEHLQNLGDVARYVKGQPAGSSFNNSNTLVGAMADYGGHVLEHTANSVVPGSGTVGKFLLKGLSKSAEAKRILAPGAGLTRLDLLRSAIKSGGT